MTVADHTPAPLDATPWSFYGRPAPFVGRVKELHALREALRNTAESGRRRGLLLMGPAGIGKTRLLARFAETAEEHVDPVTVVRAACMPDGGPPYTVFRRMLEARYYIQTQDAPEAARARLQAGLAQILKSESAGEEAAHFIGHLVGLRYPRSKHILSVDAEPRRIEERAVSLLSRVLAADAARAPLTIIIDNLHLASDESISLLNTLTVALTESPVLFIGSGRPRLGERHRPFTEGFRRSGQLIELTALADRHCRRIVGALLDRADEVPEPFVKVTCEKAMGNPLTLEQIIQLQIEQGIIDVDQAPWQIRAARPEDVRIPGSLRDVVRSKLARLATAERRLLEKAAAIGEVFWTGAVDMLRRVDAGDQWEEGDRFWRSTRKADELGALLEALRSKEIILRDPRSRVPFSREYAFKHTLERELLYEGIEGPRRARYHRLIAQWLEAHVAERDEGVIEQIALHWERGHHPRKAATWYHQAGDRARESYLNAKATVYYEKALACLTDDDAVARLEVFHSLGKVHLATGAHAEALGHFQEMLRLAWSIDDALQGGLAYNKMGQSYRALGEYELALEHFLIGLGLFRQLDDQRGIAMSLDDIGRVHWLRGAYDRALELYEEGLRLRRAQGDARSVALSLYHVGSLHSERGDFRTAVTVLREALEGARGVDDRRTEADVLNNLAVICYHRGEHEKALTLWDKGLEIARALGERGLEGMLLNNLGETSLLLGEVEKARDQLIQAVDLLEAVGDRRALSDSLRNLGSACLRLDDYGQALDFTERALEVAEELGARTYAALAERTLGEVYSRTLFDEGADHDARVEAAERHFVAGIEALERVGHEAELGRSLLAYGAFLAEIGRVEQAREQLTHARTLFERLDMRDSLERARRILDAL